MSAKCASCHYPLSVCDSIACNECFSYFHLDCAQLVGFPLFELSAEPSKNSFHCTNCQLLPLPVHRGDSDSSEDEGMPSRQFDYTLEAGSESKDMNEVKGSIQDLSDLCKDMLREINDLKSINLTLRCCIENLRHDNEQRDCVISELKRRLDFLEAKHFGNITESLQLGEKLAVTTHNDEDLTKVQPDESSVQDVGYDKKRVGSDSFADKQNQHLFANYVTSTNVETEGYELKDASNVLWGKKENKCDSENKLKESEVVNSETENKHEEEKRTEKYNVQVEEVIKAEIISETERRQDWSWKGSQAVKVDKQGDESEEEDEESEEETDNKETPSWKKLQEEIESAMKEEDNIEINEEIKEKVLELGDQEIEELWKVRKSVTWDENIEEDSDTETYFSQKEPEHRYEEQSEAETETFADDEITDEGSSVAGVDERLEAVERELHLDVEESMIKTEHRQETDEIIAEEQFALESSEVLVEEESRLEGVEASIEADPHLEGEVTVDGEPRLEEETTLDSSLYRVKEEVADDEKSRLEGEVTEEGDVRLEEEVTADKEPIQEDAELHHEEEVQPPESPNLTEEDLWLYLKENVSSVHPSTVEEFVQNLIGTLQHVPQEYLKPVIDANIKRANSPSVTDGEHLPTTEGNRPEEGEVFEEDSTLKNDTPPLESPVFGDDFQVPGVSSALEATD